MIEIVILILVAICSVIANVIIHEAGHLVFGLATGYEFISFHVFNIRIYKADGHIRVGRSRVAGAGGQCAMTPAFPENDTIPYFWYNAGGTIFNLLTGILLGAVAFCFAEGSMGRTIVVFVAIVGLFFAVCNGIPMQTRLIPNDAYNILMMAKNPSARRAFWRIMKINQLGAEGKKLLDCPKEWFSELPDYNYRNPLICGFAIDTVYYHLERQDYRQALDICDGIIATKGVAGIYRNEAVCEKQFCEIMLSIQAGRDDISYSLSDKNLKERLDPLISYHTKYAYAAFVLHDHDKAVQVMNDFHIQCEKDCNRGSVEHEKFIFDLFQVEKRPEFI